jgi:prevent-host-death family protein
VQRIGIRELRNDTSKVVRRAMAGERIVVTIDGAPAAEIGPLTQGRRTLDELIAAGLVIPPRSRKPPRPARPVPAPPGPTTTELIRKSRDR